MDDPTAGRRKKTLKQPKSMAQLFLHRAFSKRSKIKKRIDRFK